ncbi:alpha/beta hydrolase [Chloroflexota bacterium]
MIVRKVSLKVDGLNIAGQLYLPDDETRYAAVVVCHGIPARAPDPADRGYPVLAETICREGLAVFIFNFRGAGQSEGDFDILGWTRDLRAVIDYLGQLPGVGSLSVLGFSGGAAVSVYVAAQDSRLALVVACACPAEFSLINWDNIQSALEHFRSIGVIKDRDFPQSTGEWLDNFRRVNPIDHVAGIAPRPLLLVHGDSDDVVDLSHARRLYDRAGEPKRLVVIDGAGHRLKQDERAMNTVINWLKAQAGIC